MPLVGLLICAALVAANGFFVVSEFALARVRPTQVVEWEREGRVGARTLRHALKHLDAYLAACQLGITMASLGLGAVGARALRALLDPVLAGPRLTGALAFGTLTLVHVVAGELAPKSVAIARTERAALLAAPPLRAFYVVTKPLVEVFNGIGNLLLKPFNIPPAREVGHAPPSEIELHELLGEAGRQGLIDLDEQRLSQNALSYDELRARQIMVPRSALRYVTTDMDVAETVSYMRDVGTARLPLCEPAGGLDAPVGLLHATDLLGAIADGVKPLALAALARPLDRVPETMQVDELLAGMRRRGHDFVLVVDEHDTTVGGVAIETILDVILSGGPEPVRHEDGAIVVPGSARVYAMARELGIPLPSVHQATVGGVVLEALGRIPKPGDIATVDGLRLEVIETQGWRVNAVRVTPRDSEDG